MENPHPNSVKDIAQTATRSLHSAPGTQGTPGTPATSPHGVEMLTLKLDSFEGPFDLLLHLIQIHELDISRLAIEKVTRQYLQYIRAMQELDFDLASEFLVMAATLVLWKSRALLPVDPESLKDQSDEEAPITPEELMRRLMDHQLFLKAGEILNERPLLGAEVFARINPKPPIERVWRQMDVTELALSFQDILLRARKRTTILKKETVSIRDTVALFKERLQVGLPMDLRTLMSLEPSAAEKVVTLLTSLELGKVKKLRLHQQATYQPILLELLESLHNLNLGLLMEFEDKKDLEKTPEISIPSEIAPLPGPSPDFEMRETLV